MTWNPTCWEMDNVSCLLVYRSKTRVVVSLKNLEPIKKENPSCPNAHSQGDMVDFKNLPFFFTPFNFQVFICVGAKE